VWSLRNAQNVETCDPFLDGEPRDDPRDTHYWTSHGANSVCLPGFIHLVQATMGQLCTEPPPLPLCAGLLVVMPSSADFETDCAQEPEHRSDDEQKQSQHPHGRIPAKQAENGKEYAESNHDPSVVVLHRAADLTAPPEKTLRVWRANSHYKSL
jgi:hypothetical protein